MKNLSHRKAFSFQPHSFIQLCQGRNTPAKHESRADLNPSLIVIHECCLQASSGRLIKQLAIDNWQSAKQLLVSETADDQGH